MKTQFRALLNGTLALENFDRYVAVTPRLFSDSINGIALLNAKDAWCNGCMERGLEKLYEVSFHELLHTERFSHAEGQRWRG